VVRVTVTAGPGRPARGPHRRRAIGLAGALAATIAAVVLAVAPWHGDHPPANPRDARARARAPGPAGVAAAYGYPLKCLSVAIALHDPRFARADFDHAVPCGRYTGFITAIFRRADGEWVPVLKATSYLCPVRALPVRVQAELGVCPTPLDAASPPRASSRQWARSLTQ
jgi:hypothetical protein